MDFVGTFGRGGWRRGEEGVVGAVGVAGVAGVEGAVDVVGVGGVGGVGGASCDLSSNWGSLNPRSVSVR